VPPRRLAVSGIPFRGPIGAAKVGYRDGQYLLNPTAKDLQTSMLDLVVAGTADAVLMVESEAKMLSEAVMLGAVVFGHEQMQVAIRAIKELAVEAGKPAWDWQPAAVDPALVAAVAAQAEGPLARPTRSPRSRPATRASARSRRPPSRRSPAVNRRSSTPARCPTSSASSSTTSCVAVSSPASRASTGAT